MKTKFTRSISILMMLFTAIISVQCSGDDSSSVSSGKVTFTIDGVSYKGIPLVVNPSTATECVNAKVASSTAGGTATIQIWNYVNTNATVYPAIENLGSSCTNMSVALVMGTDANQIYYSVSGTWSVSGNKFTLNCSAILASQAFDPNATPHTITATGTLK